MPESNHESLRRLFDLVLAAAPGDRGPLLDHECGGDAGLRKRIEAMVAAAEDDQFLSEPTRGSVDPAPTAQRAAMAAATLAAPAWEGPGTRIGPYKLLQLIGEGGFGSVFMAEQERPVSRKVALKIIKLGMDTRAVIARFEAERQALAMMDHPNIARVLDAGATDTGRPFFVMELVKGDPIVEYCDKSNLSIEDRLALFAQVCNAVQHAHTKGIIHRDIKPSNVLVSTQDGRPHAKVIDFGIAKATASRLTEKTLFTEHRQLIGTPEYMSPEQAEGNLDIDTRTDVYSLGVLLYELLTGTTPFSSKELRSAAYAEIQRIIREVEPPKPSTRLSANTDTIASVAARRHTEPRRLGLIVRGELDWIVMKALEKDRTRRYETASSLAADVARHLAGEPVMAAPPSAAYRIRKFVSRHRGGVVAGTVIAATLMLGIVGTGIGFLNARAQQRDAEAARTEAQKQAVEAKAQAAIAAAVTEFLTDMFAAADPENLLGDRVTVVQAMRAAVEELDKGSLRDQPLVEAQVRAIIGNTLRELARLDAAEPNLRKSLALWRQALPAGHPMIADGLNTLAVLLRDQNKLSEAEPLFREALEIDRAAYPAGHPHIAVVLSNLALLRSAQNNLAEAELLFREALEIDRAAYPAGHPEIAADLSNLASLLLGQRKLAEAEPLFREALEINRAAYPPNHPDTAILLDNLAKLLHAQYRRAEAEPLLREALRIRRAVLPATHPDLATGLANLAVVLQAQNNPAEAESLFRESLEIRRAVFPAGHPDLATGLSGLARLLQDQGKLAEAEPLFRESLEMCRTVLPAGHPDLATGLSGLARLLQDQGKLAEAEPLAREALAIQRAALPAGDPGIASTLGTLAAILQKLNKPSEAEPLMRESLAIRRAAFPAGHPEIAFGANNLGWLLWDQKKLDEAEPLFREALAIRRAALPAGHPLIGASLHNLASLFQAQNKLDEAELFAREALAIRRAALPTGHPEIAETLNNLAMTLMAQHRPAEAEPLFREALAIVRATFPAGHPHIAWALINVAWVLQSQNEFAEAALHAREALEIQRRFLPPGSDRLSGELARVGAWLLKAGTVRDAADAEPLLRESLEIRRTAYPDGHPEAWRRFSAQRLLGRALVGIARDPELPMPDRIARLQEAEPLLLEAHDRLRNDHTVPPPGAMDGDDIKRDALEQIISLYELWEIIEPGSGHGQRADEFRGQLPDGQ